MLETIFGGVIGFILFTLTSHPKTRLSFHKKIPEKKIKNVQIMPRLTISIRNQVIHLHHWMILAPIYLIIQNYIQSNILHGLLLGGIFQGLLYKDRFTIFSHKEDFHLRVKDSSYHIPLLKKVLKKL